MSCVICTIISNPDQLAAVQYPHLHPTDHQTGNQFIYVNNSWGIQGELIRACALVGLNTVPVVFFDV